MPKDSIKDKVEGNELDLSLSQLEVVPVKELSQIPKATNLDLSCNLLTTIPSEFCSLIHIVKLDLSKNQLTSLPENFGELRKLQHLDLFSNKLLTVPISFCHFKNLKWLDLKENQLVEPLNSIAGDCLDDLQCKNCARDVITYMKKVDSDQERERQKKLKKQRELEALRKAEEEEEKNRKKAQKKAEKERRKKQLEAIAAERRMMEEEKHHHNSVEQQSGSKPVNGHAVLQTKQKSGFGCCGVLLTMLAGLVAVLVGLYFYCESHQSDLYCRQSKSLALEYKAISQKMALEYKALALEYYAIGKNSTLEYYGIVKKQVETMLQK